MPLSAKKLGTDKSPAYHYDGIIFYMNIASTQSTLQTDIGPTPMTLKLRYLLV